VKAAHRDRVTIDLCGLRPAVEALAASHRVSLAALGRAALRALLDRSPSPLTPAEEDVEVIPDQKVKFTVRLHRGHVERVIADARALGMSYGSYLSWVIDGAPPPVVIDPRESIAALAMSTDRLTVIAADLDGLMRSMGRGAVPSAEHCGRPVEALAREVRSHVALASQLMSELMPARPRRRAVNRRRKERVVS
jgi:hypothetical protein